MTTENEVVTDTVAELVIDQSAAEQAKREAEMQAQDKAAQAELAQVQAEMDQLRADESALAAKQDEALAAVKAECDAYRAALTTEEQQ